MTTPPSSPVTPAPDSVPAPAAWPQAFTLPVWGPVASSVLAMLLVIALAGDGPWGKPLFFWGCLTPPLFYWWITARRRKLSVQQLMGPWQLAAHGKLVSALTLACIGVRLGWWWVLLQRGTFSFEDNAGEPLTFVVMLGAAVTVAPLAEEILFRGIIFPRLSRAVGAMASALLSSAVFGLAHGDPLGSTFLALLLLGAYLQTRSLWVPVLTHSLTNLIPSLLVTTGALQALLSETWLVIGIELVCLPWAALLLRGGLRELRPLAPARLAPGA
jgi:membrane protease YdiL (CAAX protease family)